MIIDTHTHFYDPSRPQGVPWPPTSHELLYRTVLPSHYREIAEQHGVTGTVVVEASGWLEDNQWLLDLAEVEPFIVGVVGNIEPCTERFGEHLARFSQNPLFRGIRLGGAWFEGVDNATFVSDMERLATAGLELDVLGNSSHVPGVAALAQLIPSLRIVVNHMALVPIDGGEPPTDWRDGMALLSEQPNVFMKASAATEITKAMPASSDPGFYAPVFETLWQCFGEDRLIWGSDWPVCEQATPFGTAFRVADTFFRGKGPQAMAKCFRENAERAYGLPVR